MSFFPLEQMMARVERFGQESDTALFNELLYAGEFILKLTTAGLVACVQDDRENHRYRLLHALVRADGLGEWARALDEVLAGPASQELTHELYDLRKVLTERVAKPAWQEQAVRELYAVLHGIHEKLEPSAQKVALRSWFQLFTELRNKTRGHGAITPAKCAEHVTALKSSIHLVISHNPVLSLPWAYIRRNLSGKYRVVPLGGDESAFKELKTNKAATGENFADGIYVFAGRLRPVELIYTDADVTDFFCANGDFKGAAFEFHSLISDSRFRGDGTSYLPTASERRSSETEGRKELEIVGNVFSNMPSPSSSYVSRPELEKDIESALLNDRHPIVTLVGRGGIGKTSLALSALHKVAFQERYSVIVWFSSRDIDLMMSGPKPVKPSVLTDREIAEAYQTLILPPSEVKRGDAALKSMAEHLHSSPLGPTLFVFDNFETVRSPIDLFQFIDTNIRPPNKVLITTRFRDFKADYPIEVSGMEHAEAVLLVDQTASTLKIENLIDKKGCEEIIDQSDGHPYVIKMMLGEMADAKAYRKPAAVIARKDDILDALFERTYANLSPLASRIFQILGGWRSLVPQLAVEALLLRHGSEVGNPQAGIDQLVRMSLVERTQAGDGNDFLEVPLAASIFAKRKLELSPNRSVIESDIKFLQDIGSTSSTGLKEGIGPRIDAFFRRVARTVRGDKGNFADSLPVLEFLAKNYPPAWMMLASLHEEARPNEERAAAEYVRRFLETKPSGAAAQDAWRELLRLYRKAGDVIGGCAAFVKAAEGFDPEIGEVSMIASELNMSPEMRNLLPDERRAIISPLIDLMEERLTWASATDLSRLAWLYLSSGKEWRAKEVAELGLRREPGNYHCQNLVTKLSS